MGKLPKVTRWNYLTAFADIMKEFPEIPEILTRETFKKGYGFFPFQPGRENGSLAIQPTFKAAPTTDLVMIVIAVYDKLLTVE